MSNLSKAILLYKNRDFESAKKKCEILLNENQNNSEAHHLLANIYFTLNQINQALDHAKKALLLDRNNDSFWVTLGAIYKKLGQENESVSCYRNALIINASNLSAIYNLGNHYFSKENYAEALKIYRNLTRFNPTFQHGWIGLASSLVKTNQIKKAQKCFEIALQIKPNSLETLLSSIDFYLTQKKISTVRQLINQLLSSYPSSYLTWLQLGDFYFETSKFNKSIKAYKKANLLSNQKDPSIINKLAINYQFVGEILSAGQLFKYLEKNYPNYVPGLKNYAHYLLLIGNMIEGFEKYESRLRQVSFITNIPKNIQSIKHNSELNSSKILVISEQGFGDIIQFLRYLPELEKYCESITLICPHPLINFIKEYFRHNKKIEVIDKSTEKFDYYCFLMSLPHILNKKFGTPIIINSNPNNLENIKEISSKITETIGLTTDKNKLKIGISYSGRRSHPLDKFRSIPVSTIDKIILPNHDYYLIQKEKDTNLVYTRKNVKDLSEVIHNFSDTAAAVLKMDLIITVDTSLAHIAGTLNKKTYLLLPYLPDWRWQLSTDSSPWYPSIKIFRQEKINDWSMPLNQILNLIK